MSKKKSFTTAPDGEGDYAGEEKSPPPTFAEQAEQGIVDDDLQTILDTCDSVGLTGGHVKMFLRRKGETEGAYVGKMSIETFRADGLDTLAAGPGGGDYTFKFCDSNGQFVKQRSMSIDPRFKGNLGNEPVAAAKPDAEDRFEKLVEKLKPAPQDTNMMQMFLAMITSANQNALEAQKTMVTMMVEGQKSSNAILAAMMASMNKPATDPVLLEMIRQKTDKTPLVETIEAMVALKSLQDEGGGDRKSEMLEKAITAFGPALMAMMSKQPMMLPTQPQQLPEQTARVVPGPVAQNSSTLESEATKSTKPKLGEFIPMLLNAARKQTPPAVYYEVICDTISTEQLDELCVELERDTWFETLFGSHGEVTAQRQWFEKLREAFLVDDDAEEQPPAQQQKAK